MSKPNSLKLAISRLNNLIREQESEMSWWARHPDNGLRKVATGTTDPDSWHIGYLKGLRMARTLVEDPDYLSEEES